MADGKDKRSLFAKIADGLGGMAVGLKDPQALGKMNKQAAEEQARLLENQRFDRI